MESKLVDSMPRKERERARHRQEILAAAERIFVRKGYQATTVEEIAKEAEFAVGTLYNLFKSKEEIYTRVIEDFIQQFMADFQTKVAAELDPEKAVAALIELRLRHYDAHREFIRIVMDLSPCGKVDPARSLPPELRSMHDRYLNAVVEIFQRGIAQQRFDRADPLYYTLCLEGIINAFIAYWSRNEPADPLDVRILKLRREFIERIKVRLNEPSTVGDGAKAAKQKSLEHI